MVEILGRDLGGDMTAADQTAKTVAQNGKQPRLQVGAICELRLGLDATPISDAEFLDEMLVDWDLKNRRGEPVIYSPTARKDCEEELDGMDTALIGAYFDAKRAALSPEAIAKNSEPQPATTS